MTDEKRRVHLFISGRVQGVYYRVNTRDKAVELNLTGFVRNLPDGRVEVVAEGAARDIDRLVDWCRQGPPLAMVNSVKVAEESVTQEFTEFIVKR